MNFQGNHSESTYKSIILGVENNIVHCRYYQARTQKPKASGAVIYVGGIGGGFDTPAKNLYPKLVVTLVEKGISGLRIQFRDPLDLRMAVQDVLAGIRFLEKEDTANIGLVGHSFGGAVVIQTGAAALSVKTVVTLATQGYGADAISKLSPYASVLLIHGEKDTTLSPENSMYIYSLVKEPRKIVLLKESGHGLDENAELVFQLVLDWLLDSLGGK